MLQQLHRVQLLQLPIALARHIADLYLGPQRYTPPPGWDPKDIHTPTEMAGVDDLVVYMQTAVKYSSLYIHHPGGASRPRGGVYRKCCILPQFGVKPIAVTTVSLPVEVHDI